MFGKMAWTGVLAAALGLGISAAGVAAPILDGGQSQPTGQTVDQPRSAQTAAKDEAKKNPSPLAQDTSTVPEPSSVAMFVGLGGLALLSRRSRRACA